MTTTTTPLPFTLAHVVEVEADSRYDDAYRAVCSCGWSGDIHREAEWAHVDAAGHRDLAPGPGDALDGVMSDLLDLQDDLARVVVWLAENWTAGLPAPTVYGSGGATDPARIDLSVYCGDAAELDRVAAVVGVAAVDDDQPDTRGNRYRRACRPFGRVTLMAFTGLDPEARP